HTRELKLSGDGTRLEGRDRLGPPNAVLRLSRDVPFAIHFHLHPDTTCERKADGATIAIYVGGREWHFTIDGARAEIDESTYFADFGGPRRTQQIVLRGATFGDTTVAW